MGVKECGRTCCPNIMCDRCILDHSRYICEECWKELLYFRATWPDDTDVTEVREKILAFMDTMLPGESRFRVRTNFEIDDEFERVTGYRPFNDLEGDIGV